jgi:hypothetical protein
MKILAPAAALAITALAACTPNLPSTTQATTTTGHFEIAVVTGTNTANDNVLKVNVDTGATWLHCCTTKNADFTSIGDDPVLPAGDYHLHTWSSFTSDGVVTWNAYRGDNRSGRTWVLVYNNNAYHWQELNGLSSTVNYSSGP